MFKIPAGGSIMVKTRDYRAQLLASVAVSALLAATPAFAQMAPPIWAGPFVGINGGAEVSSLDVTDPVGVLGPGTGAYHEHKAGFLGGAQAGYDWQFSSIVLGGVVDIDGGTAKASGSQLDGNYSSQLDVLGTARVRLGYAFTSMPMMVYGTGGLAFADVKDSVTSFISTPYPSKSGWRTGWTAGAGAEYMFARGWSVEAQVLYVDLGSTYSINSDDCVVGFKDRAVVTRAGINFHF